MVKKPSKKDLEQLAAASMHALANGDTEKAVKMAAVLKFVSPLPPDNKDKDSK